MAEALQHPQVQATEWSLPTLSVSEARQAELAVEANGIHDSGELAVTHSDVELTFNEAEPVHTARNRKLFAPQETTARSTENKNDSTYDILFSEQYDAPPVSAFQASSKERKLSSWPVTEDTRRQAATRLEKSLSRSHDLAPLLNKYLGDIIDADGVITGNELTIVDALRTNASLRLEVGVHFLDKINWMSSIKGYMPDRIEKNTDKGMNRNVYDVSGLKSREYAAALCLAKLDGTFDDKLIGATDDISVNSRGDMQGQHRHAADIALGIDQLPRQR